jgi:hypothetical protein
MAFSAASPRLEKGIINITIDPQPMGTRRAGQAIYWIRPPLTRSGVDSSSQVRALRECG